MGDYAIQIPISLYPFRRGLWPDFRYARNVVGRITHERQVIRNAFRRDAKLGFDAGHIQAFVAHGVDQSDLRRHQLC